MAYTIDKYNGTTVAVVEDGTIDSTLDIKLIGKNYAGYGEAQNENLVHMLENFAGPSAPPRPINGQMWYDSSSKKIKFYDQSTTKWKTSGGSESSSSEPTGLSSGDFWFDTANNQLYVYNGTSFVLVGPQGLSGVGTTQLKSIKVFDVSNNPYPVVAAFVDGKVAYTISTSNEYTLNTASQDILNVGNTGSFTTIKKGITLANLQPGDVSPGGPVPTIAFWGTASSARRLVNSAGQTRTADDFIEKGAGTTSFIGPPNINVKFGDVGYTLGNDDDLEVKVLSNDVIIERKTLNQGIDVRLADNTQPSNLTKFRFLTASQASAAPYTGLTAPALVPDVAGNTNLGAPGAVFNKVYANEFVGTTSRADELKVGANYRSAAVDSAGVGTVNTVAVRDSSGRLCAAAFLGNATSATTAVTATQSNTLLVGANYRSTAIDTASSGTPFTVPCRDNEGNLNAVLFQGTATSALFADLAEKYLADDEYEVGTVVTVGGDAEVTACRFGDRAFGAVSANPAYMMNAGLEGGTYIALKGRVPVKVVGSVKKGDKLVAAGNGCAGAARNVLRNTAILAGNFPDTFAIALETNDTEDVKLVEAIIL